MSLINIQNGDFYVTKEIIVGKNTTYQDLFYFASKAKPEIYRMGTNGFISLISK